MGRYEAYTLTDPITYEGFDVTKLYAKVTIKTPKLLSHDGTTTSNVANQTVYLPINVLKMKAKTINYKLKNALDEEWYKSVSKFTNVSFEGNKKQHDVIPDWSKGVKYYKDKSMSVLAEDIFEGGTYYLKVPGDVQNNLGQSMGTANGTVEKQIFTVELKVDKPKISQIKFYKKDIYYNQEYQTIAETELKNPANYVEQYAGFESTGKLNPSEYLKHNSDYLKTGEYGNFREGTPVLATLENGESSITYVKAFDLSKFKLNEAVTKLGVKLGNIVTEVDVNVLSTTIDDINISSACLTKVGTFEYNYDVQQNWNLPSNVDLVTSDMTYNNTSVVWDKAYPGSLAMSNDIQDGKFVRKATIFAGTEIEQVKDVTFNITNQVGHDIIEFTLKGIEKDGDKYIYNAFSSDPVPSKADVVVDDGSNTTITDVDVTFRENFRPTYEEIRKGQFTRKATFFGDKYVDLTFEVIGGQNINIDGLVDTKYQISADDFYKGLNKKATVNIGGVPAEGTVEWYYTNGRTVDEVCALNNDELKASKVTYTQDGLPETEVFAMVKINNDKHCLYGIKLTVARAEKSPQLTRTVMFDTFGQDTNAELKNIDGEEVDVEVKVGNSVYNVRVKYQVPETIEKDFNKVTGKDVEFTFTCVNPDYKANSTDNVLFKGSVYIMDRRASEIKDDKYKSLTIDPTMVSKMADLNLPNKVLVETREGQPVEMFIEWPSDSNITIDGGDYNDAEGRVSLYRETSIGLYCYELVNKEYKYMLVSEYEELQKKNNPNYVYTGRRFAKYSSSINIPTTVLRRRVLNSTFVLPGYTFIYETKESNDLVRYYRGSNKEFIKVYFGNNNLPKKVQILNIYKFDPNFVPEKITLTYGALVGTTELVDCERTFDIELKGIPSKENMQFDIKKNYTMRLNVLNNGKAVHKQNVTLTIESAQPSMSTTNIASDKVDLTDGGLKHRYGAYDSESDSIFTKIYQNQYSKTTMYFEGRFVTLLEWSRMQGVKDKQGYSFYKTLGDGSGQYRYSVDPDTRQYKIDPAGDYVYAYSYSDEVSVEWDLADLSYSHKGGRKYVKAKLRSDVFNSVGTVLKVPVYIESASSTSETFESWSSDYFVKRSGERIFDYVRKDDAFFERYDGYTGQRYIKTETGYAMADARDPEAIYKDAFGTKLTRRELALPRDVQRYTLKRNGKYVEDDLGVYYKDLSGEYKEMAETQKGVFKYLPETVKLSNGKTVDAYWDVSGFSPALEGGEFRITLKINVRGEFNYLIKANSKNKHDVGIQNIYYTVVVKDNKATSLDTSKNSGLANKDGFVNMWTDSEVTPNHPLSAYTFKQSEFEQSINAIKQLILKNEAGEEMKFTDTASTSSLGTFKWIYNDMTPNTLGNVAYLKALITLKDGTEQTFSIPFAFTEDKITKIKHGSYESNINNNVATTPYPINIYDATTHTLPNRFDVTYNSAQYKYKKNEFGYMSKTTVHSMTTGHTVNKVDADVTMKSDYKLYIDGTTSKGVNGEGTLYFGDYAKLTVPYTVAQVNKPSGAWNSGLVNASKLVTRKNGYPVVWRGTAKVYRADGSIVIEYNVEISSRDEYTTLTADNYQRVVYTLTPYYGVILDINNNIISGRENNGTPKAWASGTTQTVTIN